MSKDFSWYVSKIYEWLKRKAAKKLEGVKKWFEKYLDELEYRYKLILKRLKNKWDSSLKHLLKYSVLNFLPYVVVYGVLLNIVTFYFLGFKPTLTSVTAHGLLWYFAKEEVTEILEGLKPTIEADVKVKDR